MILICVFTDVLPALTLIFEKGEQDLMKKPPRSNREHLVTWLLIIHGFFFVGLFTALFSNFLFFWSFYQSGLSPMDLFFCFGNWKDGYKGYSMDDLSVKLGEAQTVNFVSIVVMQLCKYSSFLKIICLSCTGLFNLNRFLSWQHFYSANTLRVVVYDFSVAQDLTKLLAYHFSFHNVHFDNAIGLFANFERVGKVDFTTLCVGLSIFCIHTNWSRRD